MKPVLIALFLICSPALLLAQKVALVIGNASYSSVAELDNPHNDSAAMARSLAAQGFDVVLANNLARVQMRDTLRDFRDKADQADVALVYYAGHGIEISGENYLVPVDARLEDERDAELEMIELDLVLRQISGARTLKMVVLDACRNNPFVVKMKRRGGDRAIKNGLGRIEYAGADTLIAYAAAAGEITPDGVPGGNSPFTAAFIQAMDGPPTDVRRLLGRVRDHMRQSVPGAAPFVYTSLGGGEFVINPLSARPGPAAQPKPTPPVAPSPSSISQDFVQIDRNGTFEDWDAFLIKHEGESSHPLYVFALEKREALRPVDGANRGQSATQSATQPATQSATLSIAPNPTDVRPTPTPTPIPEPIPVATPLPSAITAPAITRDQAARALQTFLKDRRCYLGAIDGDFGRNSRAGLRQFAKLSGTPVALAKAADAAAFLDALAVVEKSAGIICPAQTVRRTPKPKQTAPKTNAVKPTAPAPVAATTDSGTKVRNSTNAYTRKDSTKLIPYSPADCVGTSRKIYDCD